MAERHPETSTKKPVSPSAEGQSWVAIAFATGFEEEQIKRATDPDYAKAQMPRLLFYLCSPVLLSRGKTNELTDISSLASGGDETRCLGELAS